MIRGRAASLSIEKPASRPGFCGGRICGWLRSTWLAYAAGI
jgi:hypothetical protein